MADHQQESCVYCKKGILEKATDDILLPYLDQSGKYLDAEVYSCMTCGFAHIFRKPNRR